MLSFVRYANRSPKYNQLIYWNWKFQVGTQCILQCKEWILIDVSETKLNSIDQQMFLRPMKLVRTIQAPALNILTDQTLFEVLKITLHWFCHFNPNDFYQRITSTKYWPWTLLLTNWTPIQCTIWHSFKIKFDL